MTTELGIAEAGYLARGRRRAVLGSLAMLYLAGAVAAGRPGAVKQTGSPPRGADPVARAVFRSVSTPGGMRAIKAFNSVQSALSATRKKLVSKGMLLPVWRRLLVPLALAGGAIAVSDRLPWAAVGAAALALVALRARRTWAGRRALRDLRRAYPVPEDDEPLDAWDTSMTVAVRGTFDLPGIDVFARRAGLRAGGLWADRSPGDATNESSRWAAGDGSAGGGAI